MKQYKDTPYFVDTEGNVYRNSKKMKPQLLKGYYAICIYPERKMVKIHRLIAETYIPNPQNKPQVNHINGIKTDNRVENLEWVSSSENNLHKTNILGKSRGVDINTSKLTEKQVLEIRLEYSTNKTNQRQLAKKYQVSQFCINQILNRKSWKHI